MTAKELYEKAVKEGRKIAARKVGNFGYSENWYLFNNEDSHVTLFRAVGNPWIYNCEELDFLRYNFEEVSEDIVDKGLQYENARDMIGYMMNGRWHETGKKIKEWFTISIKFGEELFGKNMQTHVDFYNKYVISEYPLSDIKEYCIKLLNRGLFGEIVAYKKQ